VAELKKMWEPEAQGKITNWNQIRASFPDKPLKLYGPGTDSGTFDYFTEAINGKERASRGDYTPSEDDNVLVQGVGDPKNDGALGYFGVAYYEANADKLKLVAVDKKGDGNCVLPTFDNVKTGKYDPLSRPLFIYVNKKSGRPSRSQRVCQLLYHERAQVGKRSWLPSVAGRCVQTGGRTICQGRHRFDGRGQVRPTIKSSA
jgi:ABC-type phosphate transport system substrate-binding protein